MIATSHIAALMVELLQEPLPSENSTTTAPYFSSPCICLSTSIRMDFDQGLAPYDLGSLNRWRSLSDHIKSEDIDRLQPLGLSGNISITTEEDVHWTPQVSASLSNCPTRMRAPKEKALLFLVCLLINGSVSLLVFEHTFPFHALRFPVTPSL